MIGEPPSLAGGVQVRSISDAETALADRPVGRDGTLTDGVVVVVTVVVTVVVAVAVVVVVAVTVVVTVVVAVVVVDEAVEVEVVAMVVVVVEVVVVDVVVPQFITAVRVVSIVIETVLGLLLPPSNQWSKEQEPKLPAARPYDWPLLRV